MSSSSSSPISSSTFKLSLATFSMLRRSAHGENAEAAEAEELLFLTSESLVASWSETVGDSTDFSSSLTNLWMPKEIPADAAAAAATELLSILAICFCLIVCCNNPAQGPPGYLEQRDRKGKTPGLL